jgi:hypothetical protein
MKAKPEKIGQIAVILAARVMAIRWMTLRVR